MRQEPSHSRNKNDHSGEKARIVGDEVRYEEHVERGECQVNFEGSSGSMDDSTQKIFGRSIDKNNIRYNDEDTKTIEYQRVHLFRVDYPVPIGLIQNEST